MEEQQSQQTIEKEDQKSDRSATVSEGQSFFIGIILWVVVPLVLVSFVGIILGANNYMNGPAHYPGWLLTIWFVFDIVAFLLVLLHVVIFAIYAESREEGVGIGAGVVIGLIFLIVGSILLYGKHLAWISLFGFIILLVSGIVDLMIIAQADGGKQTK